MKKVVRIAWRNLWRNRKRTIITIASIFFAVFFGIVMRSMQIGVYGNMIKQSVAEFSGFIQLQQVDYEEDPTLDNAFSYDEFLQNLLQKSPLVSAAVPRIESFSLASIGTKTKGVLVSAIDPELEKTLSNPQKYLLKYELNSEVQKAILAMSLLSKKQCQLLESKLGEQFISFNLVSYALELKNNQKERVKNVLEKVGRVKGEMLSEQDDGVLLGSKLAQFLDVQVGDTLVLMGQGYQGVTAAGLYPIRGIIKIPSVIMDNKLVYMTLHAAEQYFGMVDLVTTVAINIHNRNRLESTRASLQQEINNDEIAVRTWYEFNKVLKQQIESDNVGGVIFLWVLYFIVFFGILGTVLMMLSERKKEFGVMIAIGMRKKLLNQILFIEMLFMGVIGTVLSSLFCLPLVLYYSHNPIQLSGSVGQMYEQYGISAELPFAGVEPYFYLQSVYVLGMVLIACLLPYRSIKKLTIINALRK